MVTEWKVRLTYPRHLLNQPIIYELIQQYGLLTNIREAQVTAESGWLILTVRGEQETIQKGLEWVAGQGVEVEILSQSEESL